MPLKRKSGHGTGILIVDFRNPIFLFREFIVQICKAVSMSHFASRFRHTAVERMNLLIDAVVFIC